MNPPDAGTDRLAAIAEALRSDQDWVCLRAVDELLALCRSQSDEWERSLPLFRQAATLTRFPYIATRALDGIELITGSEEARRIRFTFFTSKDSSLVRAAILTTHNPADGPFLIEIAISQQAIDVRSAALHILAHLRCEGALEILINALDETALRPHAIEALAELHDARAIPYLEPLLRDNTDTWPIDNHGPMLKVRDLAKEAIEKLRSTLPPPLPPPIPAPATPVRSTKARWWPVNERLWSYGPFVVLVFEVPWFVLCLLGLLFAVGDYTPHGIPQHVERTWTICTLLPVPIGLLLGVYSRLVFRRSRRVVDLAFLILGTLLCAAILLQSIFGK